MKDVASIEVENVSKTFAGRDKKSGFKALDRANFTAAPGEFVCILGPSGCGKSTLLNILSGLDQQYEGKASIFGHAIGSNTMDSVRVAYIFQEARLLPWRTVRGNIEFALECARFDKAEWSDRTTRCLELVGLSDFADFYPLQLSGGMQQRASIARAFVIEPDVLLMDEPFSALDEMTARRMRQQLLAIWDKFRSTVIFVTHNAFEATFLGDRILIMTKGPGGRFCDEVDLAALLRPRSYDDIDIFEASKGVVQRLVSHVGVIED